MALQPITVCHINGQFVSWSIHISVDILFEFECELNVVGFNLNHYVLDQQINK